VIRRLRVLPSDELQRLKNAIVQVQKERSWAEEP
jgi:hypothetical protein